ncbi:MAG: META domain-containing protein [Acidimicrobiales bacterium]|nr:META domain-containing protein [Acidimicrobiales bacterium]
MRFNLLLRVVLLAGGLSLIAAACGDDSGSTADPSDDSSADDSGDDNSADDASGDDSSGDDGSDVPGDRGPELVGTWSITTFQLAGAEGEATPAGSPTITFDGTTVTVDTGCNTAEGEYATWGAYYVPEDDNGPPEGQGIDFEPLSRTEIDCEPEYTDQDLAIPGAVRAAASFDLADGVLTLWRNGNVMIAAVPA